MHVKLPDPLRPRALAVVLLSGLWLIFPAAAMASRAPTAAERSAIVRAAHAMVAPTERVRVSDIRVSTAGPWAAATLRLYLRGYPHPEQVARDAFYNDHGHWREGDEVGVPEKFPHAVAEDLGFADGGNGIPIGSYVGFYLIACWFFGLCALIDVALQPRRSFKAIGEAKSCWLLVELLGLPFLGVFTWAYYAVRIRPAIVEAGGHEPRRLLRAIRWFLTPEEGEAQASPQRRSTPNYSSSLPSPQQAQPCTSCGGRGRIICTNCGGRGQIPNPNPHSGSSALVGCPACGAQRGGKLCSMCGGSGKRR